MQTSLNRLVDQLNRTIRMAFMARVMIIVVRAFLLAVVMVGVWEWLRPGRDMELLVLLTLTLCLGLALCSWRRQRQIKAEEVLLHLEMKHPEISVSAFKLRGDTPSTADEALWQESIEELVGTLRQRELKAFAAHASTIVTPLILLALVIAQSPSSLSLAFSNVGNVVQRLNWGASLTIQDGFVTEDQRDKSYVLSSATMHKIELLERNMVEIRLAGSRDEPAGKIAELRRITDGELYQSFQMTETAASRQSESRTGEFRVAFAVTESVELFVPAIAASALAEITVQKLPVPVVELSAVTQLRDPWPDEQPLILEIDVEAENPLQFVRLLIKVGDRESHELVANVMAEDRASLNSTYELLLEPYVETDFAEVEVYAEAIDRSLPQPLLGRSEPLIIRTASAYGRYRQTLQAMTSLKQSIDQSVEEAQPQLPDEATETMDDVMRRAQESPFFDSLDRVELHKFRETVSHLQRNPDKGGMLQLSTELNNFLFEHEALDDRERDRDFFVAARGLSRLLEQPRSQRPVDVAIVTDRMLEFLDQRMERWALRVERLQEPPASWIRISKRRPFHQAFRKITELDAAQTRPSDAEALVTLSGVVSNYREWLDELEAKEEELREQMEQERQAGLASARDQLREIQSRQDDISNRLEMASRQDQQELADNWPATRMQQQSNINDTRRLENQMRSLSPMAGERIKVAQEMMELTQNAGNESNFDLAESGSDRAARLLRQAESAARQSQSRRSDRGRRRRVTGDNYYGQSIVGGDIEIKREYRVDERYREQILNEVRQSLSTDPNRDSDERMLLENYLRQVIR